MRGKNIGIIFFDSKKKHNGTADFLTITVYAGKFPNVFVLGYFTIPPINITETVQVAAQIETNNLIHLILAGNYSGFSKGLYTKAIVLAVRKSENITLTSFTKYSAITSTILEWAKSIEIDEEVAIYR